jgi:hypothetical protein
MLIRHGRNAMTDIDSGAPGKLANAAKLRSRARETPTSSAVAKHATDHRLNNSIRASVAHMPDLMGYNDGDNDQHQAQLLSLAMPKTPNGGPATPAAATAASDIATSHRRRVH